MAQIEIDGKQLEVAEGSTVIDAADSLGIYIPRFCYHKKLSVAANCRMCLVDVEESKKPLPACATAVVDGMKIRTRSELAVKAQQGVMEFLLINHPLDCPICDQGGECELQDLAVGYGAPKSRYEEVKRVVVNKNLGSLISTDMTRCIHCTRCVRFGVEVGGIMEMGQTGRGEHSEIGTYVKKAVSSELSGNMIDLCPVGALTSKPFRYTARTWELTRRPSVAPHDGLGSNVTVHVKDNRVKRVLPRENEAVNECWLSDRDRFSYEGLNSEDRLTTPMVKQGGEWKETDWTTALEYVAHGIKHIKEEHGADAVGALVNPSRTLEEMYLAQKLLRGLGTGNIDTRLKQSDFSLDAQTRTAAWLGMPVEQVGELDGVLVVGCNLRKEQPLLAHRVRQAVKRGAKLAVVNAADDDQLVKVTAKDIVRPSQFAQALAAVVKATAEASGKPVPSVAADAAVTDASRAVAAALLAGARSAVFLGALAQHQPDYAALRGLASLLADLTGATLGVLVEGANAVGATVAGAVPMHGPLGTDARQGRNARGMLDGSLKALLLVDAEPEYDVADAARAKAALAAAEMVVVMSPFKTGLDYADVLLPIAPFTETAGTFVSMEGRAQSFKAVVKPLGETRPAWKVFRVLGNILDVAGFGQNSAEDVRAEMIKDEAAVAALLDNRAPAAAAPVAAAGLERVGETAIYHADSVTRRAEALMKTPDAKAAASAHASAATLARLGLADGDQAVASQDGAAATVTVRADDALADGAVRLSNAVALGALHGAVALAKA